MRYTKKIISTVVFVTIVSLIRSNIQLPQSQKNTNHFNCCLCYNCVINMTQYCVTTESKKINHLTVVFVRIVSLIQPNTELPQSQKALIISFFLFVTIVSLIRSVTELPQSQKKTLITLTVVFVTIVSSIWPNIVLPQSQKNILTVVFVKIVSLLQPNTEVTQSQKKH